MAVLTITAGDATATIDSSMGGRVSSLNVRGVDLVCTHSAGLHTFEWGIYPMVPFAGRLRNGHVRHLTTAADLPPTAPPHAIHGLHHSSEWRIFDKSDSAVVMRAELGDPWPWRGVLFHTVSLHGWKLRMELSLNARDEQPAMLGWHPWFVATATLGLEFGAMYERGEDHLPTGRLIKPRYSEVDDCFTDPISDPTVTVEGLRTTLHSDCSHWVVYDGAAHGVCVEPQSGAPNAVNDSPTVVRDGGEMRRWFEIRW